MVGSTYDFWLFDLDGTVVDIEHSYIHEVISEVGDRLGHSFTDHEAELLWYGIGDARTDLLTAGDIDRRRFWDEFHAVEDPYSRANATYLYDDAADFVTGLDTPVGVVTHCQEYLTGPVLDHLDIADWFDTVVCCSDETGWKPDPEPVELAMRDLGVGRDAHVGAMAGDHPADVQAALNANLDGVHVSRPDRDWDGQRAVGDHNVSALTDLSG
jgi:phosphoglycolate phosphatase